MSYSTYRTPKIEPLTARSALHQLWDGRLGNDLYKVWEVHVDGRLVGCSRRRWMALALAEAIEAGHISPEGDTTMALARWAAANDRALHARILKVRE